MVWQLPQWLGVCALGTTGGQHLADDGVMERGVHLRWHLGRDLGFPPGGFDVYRRRHDPGKPICASFEDWNADKDPARAEVNGFVVTATTPMRRSRACENSTGVAVPGNARISIELPWTARSVTLQIVKPAGYGRAEAVAVRDGERRVVDSSKLKSAAWSGTIELGADQIDGVTLTGTDLTVCRICAVRVAAGIEDGWEGPLNGKLPIYLPITHPDWPTRHAHAPDDLAEAVSRLPALPAASRTRYTMGFRNDLQGVLYDLVGTDPQQQCVIDEAGTPVASTGTGAAPSSFRLQTLQLLALAAVDPNVARELGLYYCDRPGAGSWDYRVVGHWGATPYPGAFTTFDDLTAGAAVALPLRAGATRILSPRAATAVDASWRGTTSRALRFTAGARAAPIWITLHTAPPAVTLKVTSPGVTVRAYRNHAPAAVPVVSAPAGDQEFTIEDTAGIDTLVVASSGDVELFSVVARRSAGTIGDLNAVTFGHAVKVPVSVRVPAIEDVVALPGRAQLRPNGTVTTAVNAAGIRWTQFLARGSNEAGTPLRYHVQRDVRGTGSSPTAPHSERIVNQNRPTIVAAPAAGAPRVTARPDGWPDMQLHYVDRGLADGWYGYRVQGIDLFGRLGHWSRAVVAHLVDSMAPPPPVGVRATYVDADDPWLTDADRTWSDANGSGVRVDWQWDGSQAIQAPDVDRSGEFRVYFVEGRLNALTGAVTHVAYVDGAATSTVTTDQEWTGATNALKDEYIRIGNDTFKVAANGTGAAFTITVDNLTSPTVVPSVGRFSLAFSPGRSYRTDYGAASAWDSRIHTTTPAPVKPVRGKVSRVTRGGGGSLLVQATVGLRDPDGILTAGVLVCDGVPYRALAHRTGTRLVVRINPLELPSSTSPTVRPAVGDTLVYYPGRTYSVYIGGVSLAPSDGDAIAVAHVGVSTCDSRGNEGSVSRACKLVATRRSNGTTPAAPGVPASTADPIYASPADFYGNAAYTLTWTAVSGAQGYAVYRTSTVAVFDRDRDQRQRLAGAYAGMDFSTLVSGPFGDDGDFKTWFGSWKTDHDSTLSEDTLVTPLDTLADGVAAEVIAAWRDWAARFYPALADAGIQALADRSGNEAAFQRVNAEPVETASYDDVVDGRGVGAYLYRIRSIDASGNLGPWSGTFQPVHLYDVTPPATPAITSIVGGEQSVTLTWRANTEDDLAEYWLWRAQSAAALEDVRHDGDGISKTVVTADGAGTSVTQVDSGLVGMTTYYYRLAAVDTAGNVSLVTPVVSARAVDTTPPDEPTWERGEWVKWDSSGGELDYHAEETDGETYTTGVALQWLAGEAGTTCIVERKTADGIAWESITDWTAASDPIDPSAESARRFTYSDTSADSAEDFRYRIRIRDAAGNVTRSFTTQRVDAAE